MLASLARMSGLVGVISNDRGRALPASDLTPLLDAYQGLRGVGEVVRASAGEWGHVALVHGHVPGAHETQHGSWLLATGAVHADGPLLAAAPKDLDGQFVAVAYDAAREQLSVLTDAFGMQALYVAEHEGRTYVSTSATVLARCLGAPADALAAKVFLRAGYLFGPLSHWQGVERLGPATLLTFGPQGRGRTEYWRPTVDERVRRLSFAGTVDACVDVALETVRRRLRFEERIWADLTGGYDSRMVAGMLTRAGVPFQTSTNGSDENLDVVLARRVAQVGGYPWRQQKLAGDWQLDPALAESAVAWSDGSLELFQLGEVLANHQAKRTASPVVVTGGGGEHISARPWVHELWRAGRTQEVRLDDVIRMRYVHPLDLSVLRESPEAEVMDYFRTQLGPRGERYAGELNTTKLDAIYAYKSTGHFGNYRSASEAFVQQEIPFYLRDFFSVCFSAHHRWRNGHRLQAAVIERLDPRTAALPTTMGGPAQPQRITNAHRFVPYYTAALRAVGRKVAERVRPPAPVPPDPAVARRRAPVVRRLRETGALDPATMRSGELYDPSRLKRLLASTEDPGCSRWTLLGRVATLELALRAGA